MSSIFKMILAVLFLFCIIANSKTDNTVSESDIAYGNGYQANASTVDFTNQDITPNIHYSNY